MALTDDHDREFENLLCLTFPPEKYKTLFDRLYHFEWAPSKHHEESFKRHCVDTARFMDESCRKQNLLQDTWNGITYARLVGFLHDVGKPFVEKTTKSGKKIYTGHAQVGARMVSLRFEDEIPHAILETMSVLIDSHMCCLRSDSIPLEDKLRVNAIVFPYLRDSNLVPLLQHLHAADDSGKVPATTCTPAYDFSSLVPYRKEDKVVVYLVGPSGCGKSTLARKLAARLSAFGSVEHLERDEVMMRMALEGESYPECYRRIHDDPVLKKQFRALWKTTCDSATSKILLIDTVQTYHHFEPAQFLHRFRIGVYGVPICYFDPTKRGKCPRPVEFPPTSWPGYPNVLTERREGSWSLEVATGVWQIVPGLVSRYLNQTWNRPLQDQPTLATLWKQHADWAAIRASFPHKSVTVKPIHDAPTFRLFMVSYLPGSDVVYGATRYYRGEVVLLDKTTHEMQSVRCALPTMGRSLEAREYDPGTRFVVTPKYDGCLWHALFVPKTHSLHERLQDVPGVVRHEWGLFFLGSKQKLVAEKPIRDRMDAAMGCTFETFIEGYRHYCRDRLTTLHFEVLIRSESEELTVYYDRNFVKFLGVTTFDDETRTFSLPEPTDPFGVKQTTLPSSKECRKHVEALHGKFLEGDETCEPEGFVVYAWQGDVLVDIVKTKFVEYLAVSNPEKHPDVYEAILKNPRLMQRFQKCRHVKDVREMVNPLRESLETFLQESALLDKKQFVLKLHEVKEDVERWQEEHDEIMDTLRYPRIGIWRMLLRHFANDEATIKAIFNKIDNVVKYLPE